MIRTSQPGWNEGAITLNTSRSRRRTRFRTTAPPRRLPVARPNRVVSRSFGGSGPRGAGGTARSHRPGAPGSPSDGRASRAAAPWLRARWSGRQPLATARPTRGDDPSTAGGPHPGAEAVLLGAMALLGLVGLLHRGCARSSPSGLGDCGSRPLEAHERAGRSEALGAFDVPGIIGTGLGRVSNSVGRAGNEPRGAAERRLGTTRGEGRWAVLGRSRPSSAGSAPVGVSTRSDGHATILPRSIGPNRAGSPCEGPAAGAILRGPPAPGRPKAASGTFRGAPGGGRSPARPARRARPCHGSPSARPCHRIASNHPSNHPQVKRIEWTRSKSGGRPSESSRSRCRRPTTRRGCATPSSSTSTTTGSGSPSRTASPRTGWTPVTDR